MTDTDLVLLRGPVNDPLQSNTIRPNGLPKSNGFFGPLPMTDGSKQTATELSANTTIDGKNILYPLIHENISADHLNYLLAGKKPTREMHDLAIQSALARQAKGLSMFNDPVISKP